LIQLANGQRARITKVNYDANTITVGSSLSWTQNIGVSLPYEGPAPDIGAYEFGPSRPASTATKTSTGPTSRSPQGRN
jgi:hypothetical protein